ncbi:O-methyltransferase [Pontibacter locisalis]|uniref:O-methyltransferase n=1 Tax=Pontibacter locisalis TaxID=1719035 RepID=A0ABW5IUD4_9BACT
MLLTLREAYNQFKIESPSGEYIPLHSHTSKEQGLFLQNILEEIRPQRSLEVGLAYGISTLFILEKHREFENKTKSHIVIEPFSWGGVAEHNIEKEGLAEYVEIRYQRSDEVLPRLYFDNIRIQFAYIDTTKVFDTVLQDFYFIDKILDVGGVVVLDDCNGKWPGVQRVARFINVLPHYKLMAAHNKSNLTLKKKLANLAISKFIKLIPFKDKIHPTSDFESDIDLGLDYNCLVFQKVSDDERKWDWDKPF